MKKHQGVIGGVAGGAILIGAIVLGVVTFAPLMGLDAVAPASYGEMPTPTSTEAPTASPTPTVEPTPVVEPSPEPAPVAEEPAAEPTLCADGWFPRSVDGAGNESGCSEGNSEGQQCVSYGENNECTAYHKP